MAREPTEAQRVVGYAGRRRRLLIADDHSENRQVLLKMLAPLGFEITLAKDGQELIEQTLAEPPDLVVSDLIMPVITGTEAIRRIRQQPGGKTLPIIAISASVFPADREQSQLAGADAFLPKPVQMDALLGVTGTAPRPDLAICNGL